MEEEPTPFPFEQDVSLGSYGFLDEDRVLPTEETKNSFEVVPHEDPSCLSIPEDSISSTPSQDCVRAPSLDPLFTASEQPSQQEWETDSLSFCSSLYVFNIYSLNCLVLLIMPNICCMPLPLLLRMILVAEQGRGRPSLLGKRLPPNCTSHFSIVD